jgi:hypothetical protein
MAARTVLRKRLAGEIGAALTRWCQSDMVWGEDDCLMALANIYMAALGVDPAAAWRGRYRTERGARRLMGKGGVLKATTKGAGSVGWRRIAPAKALPGDLGVARTVNGAAGVIRHGDYWIGRRDRGFSAVDDRAVAAAWRVTCRRS